MRAILSVVIRLLAFVGKELVETVRRPGAILSLALGPFLIMAIFGLGYSGVRRPLDTVVVAPPSTGLPSDRATYQELAGGGLEIIEVTPDRAAGERALADGRADVVVIAPEDPETAFRAGRQSVIEVLVDEVDPVAVNYAGFLAAGLASEVNRTIIEQAAAEGQGYAIAAGDPAAGEIPPEVIAAPTRAELGNTSPSTPGVVAYFGPAVLALILQHLAVTLIALSLVRERTTGVMELFRISPVTSGEVLTGKILAFGFIGLVIAGVTIALLVAGFAVPMLAEVPVVAGTVALLLLASLGLGLLVATISDSERQAVQLSLLILLASVFFSGFVLDIQEFTEPVRVIAYLLPVTHGIQLLQDLMLRGATHEVWQFAALGLVALGTIVAAWLLLRRSMMRAT
jgi:ABC-2 type transport system permease protein